MSDGIPLNSCESGALIATETNCEDTANLLVRRCVYIYRGTFAPKPPSIRISPMNDSVGVDELRSWLEDGYAGSLRTAYLIMGNRLDAEDAVQEAYLQAWRHRNSLVKKSSFKPWL